MGQSLSSSGSAITGERERERAGREKEKLHVFSRKDERDRESNCFELSGNGDQEGDSVF